MSKNTDLRVVKTKLNIKTSFFKLLSEKSFKDITIQNILDYSLINRTTFYKHYLDKYDLAKQLMEEILNEINVFIIERFNNDEYDVETMIRKSYHYFYSKKDTILLLAKINIEIEGFYSRLENLLKLNYISYIEKRDLSKDKSLIDYYATMYSSFVITNLKWLLSNDNINILEKIVSKFSELSKFILLDM